MSHELPDYIVIGQVERAHGLKGQVKVKPLTDHPSRFKQLANMTIELRSGEVKTLSVSQSVVKDKSVYLSFREIDSREQAETLKGAYVKIAREQALPLENGAFYPFEVMGFEVRTTGGKKLGRLEDVMDLKANAVFVVRGEEKEYLLPVIRDVIVKIDKVAGEIVIEPLEGMLD